MTSVADKVAAKRAAIVAHWQRRPTEAPAPMTDCAACPLLDAPGPVCWSGPHQAPFAFIAEAPGRNEVDDGVPMVGPSGQLADAMLRRVGSKRSDIYVTNTVLCRPLDKRGADAPPTPEAIAACRPRLLAELRDAAPRVLVTTGNTSTRALLDTTATITSLAGCTEWQPTLKRPLMPTFHPAYVLRGGGDSALNNIESTFKRALMMANGQLEMPDGTHEPVPYTMPTTLEATVDALYTIWSRPGVWALDTETAYAGDPTYELLTVQVSDGTDTWVFPQSLLGQLEPTALMLDLMHSPHHQWVIHNASFDNKYLAERFGATPHNLEDTMALALCLTERGQDVGLKLLSRQWLSAPYYEAELEAWGRIGPDRPMSRIPLDVLARYGAADARYTARLWPLLEQQVEAEGNRQLYERVLKPAQATFADMERRGVLVDRARLDHIGAQLRPLIETTREALQEFARDHGFEGEFNPNSVPQKKRLLYDLLGYRAVRGARPTGKEFYELEYPNAPISRLLARHAKLVKINSVYIEGLARHIWPDGRIHPSFRLFGTVTGRLSCAEPNLQQVAKVIDLDDERIWLRSMFVAAPGTVFFEADYSILEVYMAYHYSGDRAMWDDLTSGDFHRRVASHVFRRPEDQIDKLMRDKAKRVTYGIMYGIGAQGLADIMPSTTVSLARQHLERWFEQYSTYHEWWLAARDNAVETGRLTTPTGRVRRWPLIRDRAQREEVYKQAVNFPNQSLAGDQCLLSLIELNAEFKRRRLGHITLTVHDSIEGEIYEDRLDEALEVIRELMPRPKFETAIPTFPIEIELGPNWGQLKGAL